jgi:hypothetical protein
MKTVKGIVLFLFGALIFAPFFVSLIYSGFDPSAAARSGDPEAVRRFGPLVLLGYCVASVVFSTSEKAIYFTPAEVNLLFPAPFSRRQLLLYKIVVTFLTSLVGTLFLTVFFQANAYSVVAAFVGLLFATLFLQLFSMAAAIVAATLGTLAYSRFRKAVLILLGVLAAVLLFWLGKGSIPATWGERVDLIHRSPVLGALLAPFRWFVEAFAAREIWPDLVKWSARCLAVDGVLAAVVLGLDAQFLESAATASERLYARIQRVRSGGIAAHWSPAAKARFSLPDWPWWGGAGPVAWRQMLTALRSLKSVMLILISLGLMTLWPMLLRTAPDDRDHGGGVGVIGILLAMTMFMLPMILTFDFRGDLDRMDLLKSLPISPTWLAAGQLATPVLAMSLIQLALLTTVQALWGGLGFFLGPAAAFVLPFNFLFMGLENLAFLFFPTRQTPGSAADFQLFGRQVLLVWAKVLALLVISGVITLVSAAVYLVTRGSWPATLVAAWVLLVGVDVALVPTIGLAFQRFDVSRDTPP